MSFDSKFIAYLSLLIIVVISGCKSSENATSETQQSLTRAQQEEVASDIPQETSSGEAVVVTYKNGSSNIQIKLDPSKDQFYMDLSGMTPSEKDSVVVKDSTLIKNRAIDIQALLSSYRKAQDLFYLGEYRQALEEVDKTIEIQETADAYALKGTIFFMLENITAAQANWTRAVQMDPNIPVPSIPELENLIEEIRGDN